ncbi:uncharacterized protein EV422DRAFT_527498 [Fimicolochytrium jonesii]|uniref:uncharacterized protein n=1 Tax=Fimicolochytrium jonesii TaxID=1396493 RepID=UPI0022FECBC6|nr:uncharacterized protein EV422DRAFT_527498 [Fimicolochytrium jonesii]KAI8821276.1 hypothetical protein EV422DRAFT_527498 [Fimicolochytrium jonesii]
MTHRTAYDPPPPHSPGNIPIPAFFSVHTLKAYGLSLANQDKRVSFVVLFVTVLLGYLATVAVFNILRGTLMAAWRGIKIALIVTGALYVFIQYESWKGAGTAARTTYGGTAR